MKAPHELLPQGWDAPEPSGSRLRGRRAGLLLAGVGALVALLWLCTSRGEPTALEPASAARTLVERARMLRADGREREAYQTVQEARASGLDLPDADYALASLLLTAKDDLLRDPTHAIELLRNWIDSHPKSNARWNDCAILLAAALSDFPSFARHEREARLLAEVVRSREPDHPAANALLRRLDGLPDLPEASEPAQR